MYCDKCGSKLEIIDKFCEKCGAKVSMGYNVLTNKSPNYKKIKWAIIGVSVVVISIVVIACMFANSPGQKILGRWSTQSSDPRVLEFKSNGTVYNREDMFTSKTYTYKITGNNTLYMYYSKKTYIETYSYTETYYYSSSAITDDPGDDTWYIENDILYLDGRTYYRQ